MGKITIFVSSTFKDMDAERDMMENYVKPEIKKRLAAHNIMKDVDIVDLRWGVNTQDLPEEERESKVLKQCLDGIRMSRPYFVAFIGDRYGWIPPLSKWRKVAGELSGEESDKMGDELVEAKSVTELEILFGALKDRKNLSNSFFMFRDPRVYDTMKPEDLRRYSDADSKQRERLAELRKKILAAYQGTGLEHNLMQYSCQYDGRMVIGENEFLELVNILVRSIVSNEMDNALNSADLDSLIGAELDLIQERNAYFVGREEMMASLVEHIYTSGGPVSIEAMAGKGKTSVAAALYKRLKDDGRCLPLVHMAERLGPMSQAVVMLKKWSWQLGDKAVASYAMNMEADMLPLFLSLDMSLEEYEDRKVVLIINNAHRLEGLEELLSIDRLYERFVVVLTCDTENNFDDFCPDFTHVSLPEISEEEALELVDKYMHCHSKSLPKAVKDCIAAKVCGERAAMTDPLWTVVLLNHLVNFDEDDFEELRNVDSNDDADQITRFLIRTVSSIPVDFMSEFSWLMNSFGRDDGDNPVGELLAESCDGVSFEIFQEKYPKMQLSRVDYLAILREFEPLLYIDFCSDMVFFRYMEILNDAPEWLELQPCSNKSLLLPVLEKYVYLTSLADFLEAEKDNSSADLLFASVVCRSEAESLFRGLDRQAMLALTKKVSCPIGEGFRQIIERSSESLEKPFRVAVDNYHEEDNWENKFLLQFAYYIWCSNLEYYKENMSRGGLDEKKVKTLVYHLNALDHATRVIEGLTERNFISYVAESLFFSCKEFYFKNLAGQLGFEYNRCLIQQTVTYGILRKANPLDSELCRRYAVALDDSVSVMDKGALKRSDMAVELFRELYQYAKTESSLYDYLDACCGNLTYLNRAGRNEETLERAGGIHSFLESVKDKSDVVRYYGILFDYCGEALAAMKRYEEAIAAYQSAYDYFLDEWQSKPDDPATVHSLCMNLEKQIALLLHLGQMPDNELDAFISLAASALRKNGNDAFALAHLAMGKEWELYLAYKRGDWKTIGELAEPVIRFLTKTVMDGAPYTIVKTHCLAEMVNGLAQQGKKDLSEKLYGLYSEMAKEIVGHRLAPDDYFFQH